MIELGQKIRFKPTCSPGEGRMAMGCPTEVTGTVTYINRAHRWYRLEYEVNGAKLAECFPLPVKPDDGPAPSYSAHHKGTIQRERKKT